MYVRARRETSTFEHTHTQLAQIHKYSKSRNKINVVYVASDGSQYVSDWLRLDSTRLAPHGMFTTHATAKKKIVESSQEEQKEHRKQRTMSRERELSDLGKGLRLAASTSVEDNSGISAEKISIGDFIDVLNANYRWEPASIRDLAVRQGCAQVRVQFEDADNAGKLEWIPFESGRIAPFGKKVGVKHHPYHKGSCEHFTTSLSTQKHIKHVYIQQVNSLMYCTNILTQKEIKNQSGETVRC